MSPLLDEFMDMHSEVYLDVSKPPGCLTLQLSEAEVSYHLVL